MNFFNAHNGDIFDAVVWESKVSTDGKIFTLGCTMKLNVTLVVGESGVKGVFRLADILFVALLTCNEID